jgi:hypothetical protein
LREVIAPLLADWHPTVLVLTSRSQLKPVQDAVRRQLGDLVSQVDVKLTHRAPAPVSFHGELEAGLPRIFGDQELADISFRGIPLTDILRPRCSDFLLRVAAVAGRLPMFEETLRAWAPDFILAQQNYTLEGQLVALAGRRLGIPSIGLQVLLFGKDRRLAAPAVDHFLCFDQFARETLTSYTDFPAERTTVIGSVRYDSVLNKARAYDRSAERRAVDIAPGDFLVVAATQPISVEKNEEFVDLTLEALQDIPQARLVIKLHPQEPDSRIAAFQRLADARKMTERVLVTKTHDVYRLLAAADLVVNMMSNVGLEAAILDHDVVAVEIDLDIESFSLETLGLTKAARTRGDAIAQLRARVLDPAARVAARAQRQAFFRASPELQDGRSIDRLLDVIRATVAARRR